MTFSSTAELTAACERAIGLAPASYPPTQSPSAEIGGAPAWYDFEFAAWPIGEEIRQTLSQHPRWKSDPTVVAKIVQAAVYRNLRRGRQSFVLALGFVAARDWADRLVPFLTDPDVDGQVVHTLLKMKAAGFADQVRPLTVSPKTWIRRLAEKYLDRYPASSV